MVSTDKDMVVLSPEELLDCLGRVSDTRITYKWLSDKKLFFEVNSVEQKAQYLAKIAHIIQHYVISAKGLECEFKITLRADDNTNDDDDEAEVVAPSQNYMPNKTINRLIMIFQSQEDDLRVFRFEAGEGILKGHQYFEADPNIVDIECNSIQKSIQICAKSTRSNVYNIFEVNSNCLNIKAFKEKYIRAFARIPSAIKGYSVISLVRINPKMRKAEFETKIGFVRSLVNRVFLSLSIDAFLEKQSFYTSLPVDGFVLTVGAREMNKRDKTNKIQALTDEMEEGKQIIYLFYDPYQKIPTLVQGTKEVLYLNKFET
ncbi:MAG: hypothetical protein ACRBBN_18475 [Methyloligellaceae bacterium]